MTDINVNLPELPPESQKFIARIFGPLADLGDLLSDKIRFYRWESSLETMKKAQRICEENSIDIQEVPLKNLIPLLEKSSLEPEGSPLIDMWANLLAASAKDPNLARNVYCELLANLSSEDVRVLDEFIPANHLRNLKKQFKALQNKLDAHFMSFETFISMTSTSDKGDLFENCIHNAKEFNELNLSESDNYHHVSEKLDELVDITAGLSQYQNIVCDGLNILLDDSKYIYCSNIRIMDNIQAYDNLISSGILERATDYFSMSNVNIQVTIISPTVLGVDFISACRGVNLATEPAK
jgi:hypothetical protein